MFLRGILFTAAFIAVLVSFAIFLALLFESLRFFNLVPWLDFLTGLVWSPQMAGVGGHGTAQFGAVPLFTGTIMIVLLALSVSLPLGLLLAVYLSFYAKPLIRNSLKPAVELLAGVPTVVYGYCAVLMVAPFIRDTAQAMGLNAASESALAAGLVMGIMILPFVSSLADDILAATPHNLLEGSLALGLTRTEAVWGVAIPRALPSLMGAAMLAASRALGETMIVVMAAGMVARLTANPLESVTTVTVQIANLLVGDQEFDNPKTLAAFALGLSLFMVTLFLNMRALLYLRRMRRQ